MKTLSIGVKPVSKLTVESPAVNTCCVMIALGDFNADGIVDIAVSGMDIGKAASSTSDIILLIGNTSGAFANGSHILNRAIPSYQTSSLLSVDLNWDGFSDLIVGRSGGDLDTTDGLYSDTQLIYLSDSKGGYTPIESPFPLYAHNAMVADVNGDSRADAFFFATGAGPSILMINDTLNTGEIRFTTNGLPHQAINSDPAKSWTVLETHPNGALKKMQGWHQHNTAFNDVNRDGSLDMVMFFGSGSTESLIYLNNGQNPPRFDTSPPISVNAILPDLPSAGHYFYGILREDGSWGGIREVGQGLNFYETTQFDIDGDGWEDIIAVATWNNKDYTHLVGDVRRDAPGTDQFNHGTFYQSLINSGKGLRDETPQRITQPAVSLDNPPGTHYGHIYNLVALDLNGDGHLDFMSNTNSSQGFGIKNWMDESDTIFMINDGKGNFSQVFIEGLDWNQFDPVPINGNLGFVASIPPTAQDWNIPGFPPRANWEFHFYETSIPWTRGNESNNFLYGTNANDTIDGKGGVDTFVARGRRENFELVVESDSARITDLRGLSGTDLLINVERIKFYDQTIAIDTEAVGGQAYRIYKAAFDRAPDPAGLGFWINAMDNGAALTSVAGGFIGSNEFQSRYGSTSDTDFIRLLYENVLDRQPDAAGYAFWQDAMGRGLTREALLTEFSESPENKSNVAGLIANGIEYTPFIS